MLTIGLIGGISWHSTVDYYRVLNQSVAARRGGHASARIVLQSLDFAEVRQLQESENWAGAGELLGEAARHCEAGGADVLLIGANLMHKVYDAVQAAVRIPVLHIADTVVSEARRRGWSRVGLLGTRWVMEEDFYRDRLAEGGLRVDVPDAEERAEVDRVIFAELTRGRVEAASRDRYVEIVSRLRDRGAEAVVLACTEIELLLRPDDVAVPLLDSMRTHAEAAVAYALAEDPAI